MPPETPRPVPKLRGREPPKEDMNLIYSVLENIIVDDTVKQKVLEFDTAKATERANMASEAGFRTRWYTYRMKFRLEDNLPVDPNKAHSSSAEPQVRGVKPTASALNIIFSILENLKEKVRSDRAKVAARAGLRNADEAQEMWSKLCTEYQLCNETAAVGRTTNINTPSPQSPRVVVTNEAQPAFLCMAESLCVPQTQQNPLSPCTPVRPSVADVPSSSNIITPPVSVLAPSPVGTPAITGPHASSHHEVPATDTQINYDNPVSKSPANYVNTGSQTDGKCCPSKASGFRVVARNLLWASILAEEENEREHHERILTSSPSGRARANYSWSYDTPTNENKPVVNVNAGPSAVAMASSTNDDTTKESTGGRGRDTGTQTEDPCCCVTAFGFRVAFVYMFVVLDAPANTEEENTSGWPLAHLGAEAEQAANTSFSASSSASSSSSSSRSNSLLFSDSSKSSRTTATSSFHTPTIGTGLTGTPFSPTSKKAKTLQAAARYMWSLSAKAEYERDESLGQWPGWLLLDQGGGGVSLSAYENAVAAAAAPLGVLWLRVAVMI
ncbi:hypothetical protein QBC32DRAFT_392303 [Pseudoneurospora amorphoporcata]|uniref:Uncharacterized protein n=1 Tax=Pseudoneurospora amorphoporcata TaxID=241081 RepID=A0AAN6NT09_9PEZI|nr:hypothetical protein QBC32DRAFT_392303 [Pseudoneurospora amorphoporcata]